MSKALHRNTLLVLVGSVIVCGAAACTDPVHKLDQAPHASVPRLALELSDSLPAPGATIRVTIRARGVGLASATGRVAFDSTAVAFVAEDSISDGGTRVVNPTPGLIRFAAIARDSFPDGVIHRLNLVVKKPAGLQTLRVLLDEAHAPGQRDMTQTLRASP